MIEFLQNYWQLLVALACFVVELLVIILKRNKVVDSAYSLTLEWLPSVIASAEKLFGAKSGDKKLAWCIDIAKAYYLSVGGTRDISELLRVAIENILDTPEKKG